MQLANDDADVADELKRVSLDAEEAVLQVRAKSLQTELLAKTVEKTLLARVTASRGRAQKRSTDRMRKLRGADVPVKTGARLPK
jgi:circadian clock protein KaiC